MLVLNVQKCNGIWRNKSSQAGHQWLMSGIPATQEAEIRRMAVQSSLGKIVCETLSQKKKKVTKKGLMKWLKV
jgi:hypothetical protein